MHSCCRWKLLCAVLLTWLILELLAAPTSAADDTYERRRPNLIVILCDDLGYGDLGCYGHRVIQTPHLDQLARDGVRLTDCYAAAPVCSPARAGLLTGRTPNRVGIYDWIPDGSPMHLRRSEITVATLLKRAGYQTCHVGKWHCNGKFNSGEQPQPDDHGFDFWFSTQNNALPTHADPVNFVRNGEAVGPLEGYSSALIVDEAVRWLNETRQAEQPFLLFVWFHSPHEVVATAEKYTAMYRKRAKNEQQAEYFGNVTQMDAEVGRLLTQLDELELRDSSLVFFTSDNGPETLNRYGPKSGRSYGSPGPLRGMKLHLYEGGLRVPGIIRWPGQAEPGRIVSDPVCGVDVLPTFCEIAGVERPNDRAIDGASFLPVFGGNPIERTTPLYWQYDKALSSSTIALRDGDWKLLANADLTEFELYDLKHDRSEKMNLAASDVKRLQQMSAQLRAIHAAVKKEGPEWPAWERTRGGRGEKNSERGRPGEK